MSYRDEYLVHFRREGAHAVNELLRRRFPDVLVRNLELQLLDASGVWEVDWSAAGGAGRIVDCRIPAAAYKEAAE